MPDCFLNIYSEKYKNVNKKCGFFLKECIFIKMKYSAGRNQSWNC